MKDYLYYYEIHVGERTFPVHVVIQAESEEEGWKEFRASESSDKHYHLQPKGFLGEVTPELLHQFMNVKEVARPNKEFSTDQKKALRLDFEQWAAGLPPQDEFEVRAYMGTTNADHIGPFDLCAQWLIKQIGGWEEMGMAEYGDR